MNDFYEFLSKNSASILVLVLGLIGNLTGLVVFSRRSLSKFPTRNIYRSLALFDTIYLVYRIIGEITTDNGISMYLISNAWCKILRYFRYSIGPISCWLLVYISIEKFITIQFPNFKLIKLVKFQNKVIGLIVLFNLIYYIPFFSYSTLIRIGSNESNFANKSQKHVEKHQEAYNCYFLELYQKKWLYMMDLINSALLPFFLMFIFSVLLIYTIFKSRLRILRLDSPLDRKRLRKDIKFAFTSILLNITFIALNLPVCIANLLTDVSEFSYKALLYLFYLSFCINFYVLFSFNSIFRKELCMLFKFMPQSNRSFNRGTMLI